MKLSDANSLGSKNFQKTALFVDVVIFTILDCQLQVLTLKRASEPFKNQWTLVGGYVDTEQDVDLVSTAKRKLYEKTGVVAPFLAQSQALGNAVRDPRGWSVTVVYYALMPAEAASLNAGFNAVDIEWTAVKEISVKKNLAFDHEPILQTTLTHLRQQILSTTLPVHFMPEYFTLRELQNVYEIILNKEIDAKSFRRRILSSHILTETTQKRLNAYRPALLYKRAENFADYQFLRQLESAMDV